MEKKQLISVIIPVYNVEKYIEQCIKSIINQTYKKIEVILIDDGSIDKSGAICDEYAKIDKRIIVIHKENGGLSDARNKGIDIAKGEYITFVDSDDYVKENFIEDLYTAIINNNAKLSICNIIMVDEDGNTIENLGFSSDKLVNGKEILKGICEYRNLIEGIVAWNKMYSKDFFKENRYPKGKIHEDEFLTYKILYFANKVAITNRFLYYYRKNDNSITSKKFNVKRLDFIEALEERLVFYNSYKEKYLYNKTFERIINVIRIYYIKVKKYIADSKEIQKKLLKKYRKMFVEFIGIKDISFITKIKALAFYIMPNVFFELKKRKY